jgi:hypothetical protein
MKISLDEFDDLAIKFIIHEHLSEVIENHYLVSIRGNFETSELEDNDSAKEIGYIDAYKISLYENGGSGEEISNFSINDLFDSMDGDTHTIASAILDLDKFSGFNTSMNIDDEFTSELIIINEIYINKSYRGNKIGKRLIKSLKRNFCLNGSLLVLNAKPFQLMKVNKESQSFTDYKKYNEKQAISSLNNYYKKIGFNKIKGENIFFQHIQ